jgi:hypothetical protein
MKFTVYFIDYNDIYDDDEKNILHAIKNARYIRDCFVNGYFDDAVDVGKWDDELDINKISATRETFEKYFIGDILDG